MSEQHTLVEFILEELFSPHGELQTEQFVYLKPYQKQRVKAEIRKKVEDEFGIEFSEEYKKKMSKDEWVDKITNLIKNS